MKPGDRVELSEKGRLAFNQSHHSRKTIGIEGVITKLCRNPELIFVLRDGLIKGRKYHRSFWQAKREDLRNGHEKD